MKALGERVGLLACLVRVFVEEGIGIFCSLKWNDEGMLWGGYPLGTPNAAGTVQRAPEELTEAAHFLPPGWFYDFL